MVCLRFFDTSAKASEPADSSSLVTTLYHTLLASSLIVTAAVWMPSVYLQTSSATTSCAPVRAASIAAVRFNSAPKFMVLH